MSFSLRGGFSVIGASFGLASHHPGSALAPEALRRMGLIPRLQSVFPDLIDSGDIGGVAPRESIGEERLRRKAEVLEFGGKFLPEVAKIYKAGRRPIVIGGDHSISIWSITAASQAVVDRYGPEAEVGVLWVDAHGDLNTPETTPSGNIHGMTIASLLGLGDGDLSRHPLAPFPRVKASNVVYLGLRDLDPLERERMQSLGLKAWTMKDIDTIGIGPIAHEVLGYLGHNVAGFVLSFDLDTCDPKLAPGVGTPVRGGLTFREAHLIMELAAEMKNLLAIELVEYNPELDIEGVTAEFGIGLLESALGKRTL